MSLLILSCGVIQDLVDETTEVTDTAGGARTSTEGSSLTDWSFAADVVDLSMIQSIVPSGNVGSANEIQGRSYIFPTSEVHDAQTLVPVYAPVDSTLFSLSYYKLSDDPEVQADYAFRLAVAGQNNDVLYGFAHIKQVVPSIAAVAPSTPVTSSVQNGISETVSFQAGDLLGYWRSDSISIAFDFYLEDFNHENVYVNPDRYTYDPNTFSNARHQICPYDYFPDDLRSAYFAKFGSSSAPVDGVTACRGTSRDVAGSISGTWYLDGDISDGTATDDNGIYKYRLDIAMELDDEVKVGGINSQLLRIYNTNDTWLDPEDITGDYCYQLMATPTGSEGYVFFHIVSDDEMQVAYSASGLCPDTFPSESAMTYYR